MAVEQFKPYTLQTFVDGEVPPEVYIAFRNTPREKIKRMWLNCVSPIALAKSTLKGDAELVCKPSSIYPYNTQNGSFLIFVTPAGKIYANASLFNDELFDRIYEEMLYMRISKNGKRYVAVEVKPLMTQTKTEIGKEIYEYIQKNGLSFASFITIAYGYIDKEPMTSLMFYRHLTLYKVNGQAIHGVELSSPNTGKTTFGIRNVYAFNWHYLDEPPSVPNLIMDARTGSLGAVYRSNGIFIDEIDKYDNTMKDAINALLTGMSHGLWSRGKGTKSAPAITRRVNVFLAGNKVGNTLDFYGLFKQTMTKIKLPESAIDALYDRLAVKLTNNVNIRASDYISNYVVTDSYLRGFVAYVEELANKNYKDYGKFDGRQRMQYNQLRAIMDVTICYEFNCEKSDLASDLIKGVIF